MRFLPVNLNALLVELDNLEQTLALLASLKDEPIAGIEELVPAARTILIRWRPTACSMADLVREIGQRDVSARAQRSATLIEIPVHYTGEDLADVAQLLGITPEEVIRRHTGSEYTVAFTGFAPGFAYLSGGHPSFNVPRRSTPRTRIPAGAVGLAGTFSGIYPQASPGGWQIIGVTPTAMWDLAREVPALLQPGYRVKFIDIATISSAQNTKATEAGSQKFLASLASQSLTHVLGDAALEVQSPGLQTLFQDLGRSGQAGQGVSASGAMDQTALKVANRLVGNASDSAGLETAGGGLCLRSRGDTVVAVTGADVPLTVTVTSANGHRWQAARYQPLALADGDTLTMGPPQAGLRTYLAVRGGFSVQPVLGSCSTDTLAHIGPPPLVVGDVLAIRPVQHGAVVGLREEPPTDLPTTQQVVTLDVVLGPRTDWFTAESLERLHSQPWQVTPQSNRVGIRLLGEVALARAVPDELPSEGTAWGAIQVPPSGQPVLFLADHPLTGGYPVIGCVATYHLDRAGQIPIHAWVRFNPIRDFEPTTTGARDTACPTDNC
ncbi:MAG: 5-oxoprolinase subunit PxpB [Polaromonas sp.]|uniref:5-oxoprolinase subunit PxpB n=1 Tax=Polaromonas sp. TaxID=1869339 RepID=UPI00184021B1|nr:5-oxoprolinase subunit PxpB [Polaromonas sp.]NMM11101.1 5-oxoprolinase subunit PxpB [Polaromonas sp.]